MRDQLRSLPRSLADTVAQHLAAAGMFLQDDSTRALRHAREARRLAARVTATREAVALTAYFAGEYAEALAEFRAVRRMSGDQTVLPAMADCERALGRPQKALDLARDPHVADLPDADRLEMLVVAAGARRDLGQLEAALSVLSVPELASDRRGEPVARLRYAYADALVEAGRTDEALEWFHRAAAVDGDDSTGAADRAAELERGAGS